MPVTLCIRPDVGVMFVNFSGHATAAEAVAACKDYQDHPDFSAGQKHLINFSDVTSFEGDFTKLMELQAKLLDGLTDDQQVLFVFCAPTPLSQQLAQYSVNAWKDSDKVIARLLDSEVAAMDVVGLPNMTFADLTHQTTQT